MAMSLEHSVKELAENFRRLSPSERVELRSLLGEEWFSSRSEEERLTINSLLEKSKRQFIKGEGKSAENIFQESRKKYGL